MKKIINIFVVILTASLVFTSCAINDDSAIVVNQTAPKLVSFGQPEFLVESSATTFSLPVVVSPAAFGSNYLIEYTVNGVGASASINGGQAAQLPLDVSIPGTVIDVIIDRISVVGEESGAVDQDNNSTTVKVINDRISFALSWPDAANNDLDFVVSDADLFIIDNSESTTAGENIELLNSEPDGTYRVFVRDWISVLDPIPFTIEVTFPDFTVETFTGNVPNVDFQFNEALNIVKTGSTYVITQLDPTVPL